MGDTLEQKNTILNLYNSGIDPEIISIELDIEKDVVLKIIERENKKYLNNSKNSKSTILLNNFYLDAIIDINSVIRESQNRIWNALKVKPDFNISIRDTHYVLEKYAESKINLVILHIDLVGFTRMSLTLPIDRLTTIIRSFAQQMSILVSMYGGYVLKYIGDAVLAFFLVDEFHKSDINNNYDKIVNNENDNNLNSLQYTNAISCAYSMITVLQEGFNPILNQNDYPELKARVGMDTGEVAVVQYGTDIDEYEKIQIKKAHLDLIGYPISIAVKMTSLAKADNIVIGQKLFNKLNEKYKDLFKQLPENHDIWNYSNEANGKIYNIYESRI